MSRLDIFILRMQAQRACIDEVAHRVAAKPGPLLELGLGNGRTYDHLRLRFPDRPIFVFDREVAAHPDCIPPPEFLRLGDFRTSVPGYSLERRLSAAFIHADIGTFNKAASVQLAADLAPTLLGILAPGGYLSCDQPIALEGLECLDLPGGDYEGCYHLYRRSN